MSKQLKLKYKSDFVKVSLLINEFDPCGLIEGGAPADEYDDFTNFILSGLYDNKPTSEIEKGIYERIQNFY